MSKTTKNAIKHNFNFVRITKGKIGDIRRSDDFIVKRTLTQFFFSRELRKQNFTYQILKSQDDLKCVKMIMTIQKYNL